MAGFLNFLKTMISGKEYSFTVAKSFRGFKSFPMEVYLDQEARDNNYLFRSVNVVEMPLVFKDSWKNLTGLNGKIICQPLRIEGTSLQNNCLYAITKKVTLNIIL